MGRTETRETGLAALELVIVVSILVLLTGVLVPSIDRARLNGQRSDAAAAMERLAVSIRQYHHDTGRWPCESASGTRTASFEVAASLTCLRENSHELAGWRGPYVNDADAAMRDPWGQPYVIYSFTEDYLHSGGGICIVSGGPDGSVLTQCAAILAGTALQDDLVQVVTPAL